jgi:hypothetical protein
MTNREPELVCVRRCQGMLLAELYRSKLTAWDIPVLLRYESAGPVIGITVDGLGEVMLMVPADLADEAAALLDEAKEDQQADSSATSDDES